MSYSQNYPQFSTTMLFYTTLIHNTSMHPTLYKNKRSGFCKPLLNNENKSYAPLMHNFFRNVSWNLVYPGETRDTKIVYREIFISGQN